MSALAPSPDLVTGAAPEISVIICTRNRAAILQACIDALLASDFAGTWEVIVIDNGSTDTTQEVLDRAVRARPGWIKTLRVMEKGKSRGLNAGLRVARGEIIALTDDDCYVSCDWLSAISSAFKDPQLGYLTGRVILHDPEDAEITIKTSTIAETYGPHRYMPTDFIIGANLAFRRSVLDQIGGFDEDLGPGTPFVVEDVEVASRACFAGWTGVYAPEVLVRHHHGRRGVNAMLLQKVYDRGRGAYHAKLLLSGRVLTFLKAVAGVRWRLRATWWTLWWETSASLEYIALRASKALRLQR